MQLAYIIMWFVRLGPIGLGVFASVILGLGIYIETSHANLEAAKAAALINGPPAAVDVAKFDEDLHETAANEVMVQAQPVFTNAYRFTLWGDTSDQHVYMVPLVSATSSDPKAIVGIAYFQSYSEDFDNITEELMMRGLVDFGKFAPVINYNGELDGMGDWDEMTRDAFTDKGLTMPANPVIVWPYMKGREDALAPSDMNGMTFFGVFSKIAGAIGLFALAKLVLRAKDDDVPEVQRASRAPNDDPFESLAKTSPQPETMAPKSSVEPLWKQRAGLIDSSVTMTQVREPIEQPRFDPMPTQLPPILKTRSPIGVRTVLIGIIGALFVLGLVSTVTNLLPETEPVAVVEIPSLQEFAATSLADAIVPDADPNRHWTEIDVTAIVEWFSAQFMLAVMGDQGTQLMLGMIVGGVFFGLFGLLFVLKMRSSLQPKTSARFDSMGIN